MESRPPTCLATSFALLASMDAPQDGYAAAPGRAQHRLVAIRAAVGRFGANAVFVLTEGIDRPQIQCHIAYTTEETRRILLEAIPRSPLYSGQIEGMGPPLLPVHRR